MRNANKDYKERILLKNERKKPTVKKTNITEYENLTEEEKEAFNKLYTTNPEDFRVIDRKKKSKKSKSKRKTKGCGCK